MFKHTFVATLATSAAIALGASSAGAVSIGIEFCEAGFGCSVPSFAPGVNGAGPIAFGNYLITSVTGVGSPPLAPPSNLDTTNVDLELTSAALAPLQVFVTSVGNVVPTGPALWSSGLTANFMPIGWTIEAQTFLDNTDSPFASVPPMVAATTPLADHVFSCPVPTLPPSQCATQSTTLSKIVSSTAPFSTTALYTITALPTTVGQSANGTINISWSAVPGPIVGAGLPGLIAALGGLVALARRRRKAAEVS
jgi:hypothetical protein